MLIVDRRSGASEIVNFISLNIERECYVMAYQLETRVSEEMLYVFLSAREKIIDTDDFMILV